MKQSFKITEEEKLLAAKREKKIFEQVLAGEMTDGEAIERLSKVHVEWEKRYREESDKEYNDYIEKNKGKKIVRYSTETFWPIFED
jgi:hypothetical protein